MSNQICEYCKEPFSEGYVLITGYEGRRIFLHDSSKQPNVAPCSIKFCSEKNVVFRYAEVVPFNKLEELVHTS